MSINGAIRAVKKAIGEGENFCGRVVAIVENGGTKYNYTGILATVTYDYGYMQMELTLNWDDDSAQVSYRDLGLHMGYNTNFQDFKYDGCGLNWEDGENKITVFFK